MPYSGPSAEHKLMHSASINTIKVSLCDDERTTHRLSIDVHRRGSRQPCHPNLPAAALEVARRPEVDFRGAPHLGPHHRLRYRGVHERHPRLPGELHWFLSR